MSEKITPPGSPGSKDSRSTSIPPQVTSDVDWNVRSHHDADLEGNERPSHEGSEIALHQSKENEDRKNPNLVEWEENDPENPYNWSKKRRWLYTGVLGMVTFVVTFASSSFSTATLVTAKTYGVSEEVTTLGTSLFVLGFAFGPIVWGPFSEVFGRKPPLYFGYFTFALFSIGVAVAQNLYTIMICRFFGGFFASAPLAVIGGHIADMWDPVNRGIAIALFSAATFIGPVAGPIVGGFVTMSHLGWRWTQYITIIMAVCFGSIGFVVVPETFAPALLQKRARKLRYKTNNWALHSELDTVEINVRQLTFKYLVRPFEMLVKEPILVCSKWYQHIHSCRAMALTLNSHHIYVLYLWHHLPPLRSFPNQLCGGTWL
jgi:MFS transporter, DHA1 family, multidrug resistance protein